ncbi:MAG: hypothetical protein IT451_14520, partial [Candidatus Brocadia sp.]|nr:hypothetical protein [Candidatus Brocadia sp.]
YNLANLYYRQEKYENAIFALEEYIKTKEAADTINALWSEDAQKVDNDAVSIYNLLGHCYKAKKNQNKARVFWEKSLAIQPLQQEIKDLLSNIPQPLHKRISLVID